MRRRNVERRVASFFAALAASVCISSAAHAQNAKDACIDASERGQKLVDDRRLLSARNAFLTCAADACPGPIRHDCQTQLDDLKKNIPSIVVRVKDKDSDVARGAVSLDGTKVGVLDGQTVELDPGAHVIHVELPDGRTFDRQVVLAAGDRATSVTFDAAHSATAQTAQTQPIAEEPKTRWSTVRTIGFTGILVGGFAIVAGVVTEIFATVLQSNATTLANDAMAGGSTCVIDAPSGSNVNDPSNIDCNDAVADHQQAVTDQTVAFIMLGAGTAVLAAGIVMYLVGGNVPSRSASVHFTPLVGPRLAGIGLSGSF